jgi:hypothetical protein
VAQGCTVVRNGGCAQLVNNVLNDSFDQLLHSTRVEGHLVRLREQAG